jgi:hypothetical protein
MNAPNPDKKEEILQEFPFMVGNQRWGGSVQLIRATVIQDGRERVYINKRLFFTDRGRYINLPRDGVEEMVAAILAASEPEKALHEALIVEINQRTRRTPSFEPSRENRGRRGRGREDKGDWR